MFRFSRYIILFLIVFLTGFQTVYGQTVLSDTELIGNWSDKQNRQWTFGFFEEFVIYADSFWNYTGVAVQGEDLVLTIAKEGKNKRLRVCKGTGKSITVYDGTVSLGTFVPSEAGFFPALRKDVSSFPEPTYREDTVTIIGYYRNLDKLTGRNKMHYGSPYFTASIYNPVTGSDDHMMTMIDSLGRFELKFPLRTVQEVLIDWRKIVRRTVMVPGEKICIYADMLDFVPADLSESFQSRLEKPRKMWVMGDHAAFHNEQFHMVYSEIRIPQEKKKSVKDYFDGARTAYEDAQAKLYKFIEKYPALSERSITIENIRQKYMTASLLFSRLVSDTTLSVADKKECLSLSGEEFPLDQELSFYLGRDVMFYVRDYLRLRRGAAREGNLHTSLTEIDSVFVHPALRELLTVNLYYRYLLETNKPFSAGDMDLFGSRVVHPSLRNEVEALQAKYERLLQERPFYAGSLKDNTPYSGYTDAGALLEKILEPYRGKVVYIDFWGVWCGPCKRQLEYVRSIKEELKDKNVVFMYFANASPVKQWRKMIEDMDLTGEHVAHFNLPAGQQSLLEKYMQVNSFPTFVLVDKEGKIVNRTAPFPIMKENLMKAINRLLNEKE